MLKKQKVDAKSTKKAAQTDITQIGTRVIRNKHEMQVGTKNAFEWHILIYQKII